MAETYVILHNIRSAHNVGSIFRTADGAGVSKLFLTGYTPAPTDRFGRENVEIKKTSLGATSSVLHESREDACGLLQELRTRGVTVVAIEQTSRALDYRTWKREGPTAYIFGNEITGIEPEVLERADVHLKVPMAGKKESLNVSVCTGVILFGLRP